METGVTMSELHNLTHEHKNGVLTIKFNRPNSLNALNHDMCQQLDYLLSKAAINDDIKAIIITSTSDGAFSAGYDVKELASYEQTNLAIENMQRYEWIWNIAIHPKPIIAATPGIVMGAGAIIAVSADIRIGTTNTTFQFTSTPHGVAMLTWNLPPLIGWSKAKEYLMTSCKISSEEAANSGLLNQVVNPEELEAKATEMAERMASFPPSGPQNVKKLLRENLNKDQRSRLDSEILVATQQLTEANTNKVGDWYKDMVEA